MARSRRGSKNTVHNGIVDRRITDLGNSSVITCARQARTKHSRLTQARSAQQQTAIDECKKALSLNPKAADVWFRLAGIYLSQNKSQQALASYRNGLAVNPGDLSANKNYAQLLVQAGDFGAAVKPLERVTRSEPGERAIAACAYRGVFENGQT